VITRYSSDIDDQLRAVSKQHAEVLLQPERAAEIAGGDDRDAGVCLEVE
jgi:hypothetical protein